MIINTKPEKDWQGIYPTIFGLSTDDKTTILGLQNGWSFFEMDTGKVYVYDQENETWREV